MIQTRQREAILAVLQEAGRPLTRDEILQLGRARVARLGSATVDRTIRELTRTFHIIGVEFPANRSAMSCRLRGSIRTSSAAFAIGCLTCRWRCSCRRWMRRRALG